MNDGPFVITPEALEQLRQEYATAREAWIAAVEAEKAAAAETTRRFDRWEAAKLLYSELQGA